MLKLISVYVVSARGEPDQIDGAGARNGENETDNQSVTAGLGPAIQSDAPETQDHHFGEPDDEDADGVDSHGTVEHHQQTDRVPRPPGYTRLKHGDNARRPDTEEPYADLARVGYRSFGFGDDLGDAVVHASRCANERPGVERRATFTIAKLDRVAGASDKSRQCRHNDQTRHCVSLPDHSFDVGESGGQSPTREKPPIDDARRDER